MQRNNNIFFQKYSSYIDDLKKGMAFLYLFQDLKNRKEKDFYKIANITIDSHGKLLRALLTVLACETICGKYKPAIPVALAYELAHNASLVQDDIIDDSPLRRGNPSINYKYGINTAILISDIFIFQIFNLLASYKKYGVSKENICKILEIIGTCGKEATVGEYLDERLTGKINLLDRDYLRLISLKTGKLFAASSACGAIAANGSKKEIDIMYAVGEKIGIAFQIYDDILNITGDEKILKKPTFSDIENGKQNIVIIHSFKNTAGRSKKIIFASFGKKPITPAKKDEIKKIIKETGSVEYAEETGKKFISDAIKLLEKIGNKHASAKEKIINMSSFVIRRNI